MTIRLTEWRLSDPVDLSPAVRQVLETSFDASTTSVADGRFRIRPGGVVGSVRVGEEQVLVEPKVKIDRVLFMVAYAADPYRWKDSCAVLGEADGLLEGVAALLMRACDPLLAQGLMRSYRRIDRDAPYVKGRICWGRQARRITPVPLAISHHIHDDDITENQILRAAVRVVLQAGFRADAPSGIGHLWRLLEHVTPLHQPLAALDRLQWTRHNEHYRPILDLARVILAGSMIELTAGKVPVGGFTLVLHEVFERFVRRGLRAATGHSVTEFPDNWAGGGLTLGTGGTMKLKPDLGVRVDGMWRFVGDVKYKIDTGQGKDSDLYQVLAYAVATGLSQATLVYADGPPDLTDHVVRNLLVTLRIHHLDLTRPPDVVLGELGEIARKIGQ
ncbi:MAG: hypothetical protein WA892_06485 [Ornithinimicrobium sp.]